LLQIGCSGAVWPAAQLPHEAKIAGARIISIDPKRTAGLWLEGTAAEVLPELVQVAFGGQE
jgi:NAD-dependent deacetylase